MWRTGSGRTALLILILQLTSYRARCLGALQKQPNLVLILTDDQSDLLDDTDPEVMPELNKLLFQQGQRFVNYFAPTPICCPARVSLLRGQYTHNHNYTDVLPPVGGYQKFKDLKVDESYLPTWLQGLGYNTYYTGKFLVDYNVHNYNNTPKGWTDIDALVTPYLFQYYSPVFSRNGQAPVQYHGLYSGDVIADKALAQIASGAKSGKPFFVYISEIAPHFSSGGPRSVNSTDPDIVPGDVSVPRYPPLPAPRHWSLFLDRSVPQPLGSFDEEDVEDKPAWVRSLPRVSRLNLTYLEEVYRLRLRALRGVDELVGRVVRQLERLGVLDRTYLLFSADNGYHLGTHRRKSGKLSAYEEDIRVPFAIRGPGIRPGVVNLEQASHVDLAPTLVALAGGVPPTEIDGSPLPLQRGGDGQLPPSYPDASSTADGAPSRAQLPAVYFAAGNGDFDEYFYNASGQEIVNYNWTWRAVRVLDTSSTLTPPEHRFRHYPLQTAYKYTVLCTNERELYDLRQDPNEGYNLMGVGATDPRLVQRLDVLLQLLQTCWGDSCRHPFKYIHVSGTTPVRTLWDALHPQYDELYAQVPQFRFKQCLRVMDDANEVNHYAPIIGHFPRGPDGVSLAPVNVTRWCNGSSTSTSSTDDLDQGGRPLVLCAGGGADGSEPCPRGGVTVLAEVERHKQRLGEEHLRLTDEQMYGPEGTAALVA